MKPQDTVFLLVFALLVFLRKPKFLVVAGLSSIILAIPLFYFQIFFTAQRLVMYGAGFFLIAIIFYLITSKNE